MPATETAPEHIRVQPERKNARLALRLLDHHFKLIHHHVCELACAVPAMEYCGDVVKLAWIRDRKDSS